MQSPIPEISHVAPALAGHFYHSLVVEVRGVIRARFPLGAINRVDVATAHELSTSELKSYLSVLSFQGQLFDNPRRVDIEKVADITQSLSGGNCGLFTNYAIGYIKKTYPGVPVQAMYFENIDHVVVLIGRMAGLSLTDPTRWGDAVICDLWADRYYLARELFHETRTATRIPFYQPILSAGAVVVELRVNHDHYLSDRVELYDGEANARYDENLVAWVSEDRRRLALPEPTVPLHSIGSSEHYCREEILSLLKTIGKIDANWKYSKSTALAWLECPDERQARRLYDTLRLTKAMVVTLQKNKATGHLVVTCKQFDVSLMRRFASSPELSLEQLLQGLMMA